LVQRAPAHPTCRGDQLWIGLDPRERWFPAIACPPREPFLRRLERRAPTFVAPQVLGQLIVAI
jgi:hypothetical protein